MVQFVLGCMCDRHAQDTNPSNCCNIGSKNNIEVTKCSQIFFFLEKQLCQATSIFFFKHVTATWTFLNVHQDAPKTFSLVLKPLERNTKTFPQEHMHFNRIQYYDLEQECSEGHMRHPIKQ